MSTKPLRRRVNFFAGLRYRGKQGMITWMLNRITGLGILVFVGIHVVAAFFLQQFSDDVSIAVTTVYESWPFQLVVYFCVLYHAIHGTRIALEDLFPGLMRFHEELIWLQWIIFFPTYLLPSYLNTGNVYLAGPGMKLTRGKLVGLHNACDAPDSRQHSEDIGICLTGIAAQNRYHRLLRTNV